MWYHNKKHHTVLTNSSKFKTARPSVTINNASEPHAHRNTPQGLGTDVTTLHYEPQTMLVRLEVPSLPLKIQHKWNHWMELFHHQSVAGYYLL